MLKVELNEHFTFSKIFKITIAPVLMMVLTSLYSIVDGFFVSNFASNDAFAGINLIMPYIMIFGGVGFMMGSGGSALVSKTLGEKDEDLARKYFSMIIYATIIAGLILMLVGYFTVNPVVDALSKRSADNSIEMVKQAKIYGKALMLGILLYMLQNMFNNFLMTAERPFLGFLFTLLSGITNTAFDAIFIAGLKMGVKGAAIATIMGYAISSVGPFIYFTFNHKNKLFLVKTKIKIKPLLKAAFNGLSEFLSNIASSIVSIAYSYQLLKYIGVNGVSAYGSIMYISYIFFTVYSGFSIGLSPAIGYHYGANNKNELKNLLHKALICISILAICMFSIAQVLALPFSKIFSNNNYELQQLTLRAERIYSFVYLACGFSLFSSAFFTALNNGLISGIISIVRSIVFELVCVFSLPLLWQVDGIFASAPFAEIGSTLMTVFFFLKEKKKYGY